MKRKVTSFLLLVFATGLLFGQQNHFRWATAFGTDNYDAGMGITADDDRNAYMTGYFKGAMTIFDTTITPTSGENTMFLAKVSPSQQVLWHVTAEADGSTGAGGWKTVYRNNFVYLMGDFRGTATFSSTDFMNTTLSSDNRAFFIAKYSDTGVLQWVRPLTTSHAGGLFSVGSDHHIVVDDNDNVYISANFRNDIDINGTVVTPELVTTRYFSILIKLDALGEYQWHWNSTQDMDDRGEALAITPAGNIVFATRYSASIMIGDVLYDNSAAGGGIAIIEFQPDGTMAWHKNIYLGAINKAMMRSITFDQDNNMYLGGSCRTSMQWDDTTIFEPETTNWFGFLYKLNSDRNILWNKFFGDPEGATHARSIDISSEGNLLVAGEFSDTLQVNEELTLISNEGSNDGYYMVVDTETGNATEAYGFGGMSSEFLNAMAVTPSDEIYFIGQGMGGFSGFGESFENIGSFDIYVVKLGNLDTNASLTTLQIGDSELEGFDPEVFDYEVVLPHDAEQAPIVGGTTASEAATIIITQATDINGDAAARTATIEVIAENPDFSSIYTITFRLTETDASLADILIDGVSLENFDPEVFEYEVVLPYDAEQVPVVDAVTSGQFATFIVNQATDINGDQAARTSTIEVTAEATDITSTYSVVFRLTGSDASLADIQLGGLSLEGFDPEVFEYQLSLPADAQLPEVTAIANDEYATVSVSEPVEPADGEEYWNIEILVTAEEPSITSTYTVSFRFMHSDSSLEQISVNGNALEGFDATVFEYNVVLPQGTVDIPVVDASAASEYAQVEIIDATDLWGEIQERTTTINVVAEDNSFTSTYTIVFEVDATSVPQTDMISAKVYPNPAKDQLNIVSAELIREVRVIDMLGQVVYSQNVQSESFVMNVSDMKEGIYFVQIITSKGMNTKKVQISK